MPGGSGTIQKARAQTVTGLAWTSIAFGLVAGSAVRETFIGSWTIAVFHMLASMWGPLALLPIIALAWFLVRAARDLIVDGEPNLDVLYAAFALPTLASATSGKLSASLGQMADAVMVWANAHIGPWVGSVGVLGIAIVCGLVAWLLAQRVVGRGRGR